MKKIQDEIIKDFLGITKNRSVKMIFLKNLHMQIFLSQNQQDRLFQVILILLKKI